MVVNQRDHLGKLTFASDDDAQAFIGGPPKVDIVGGPVSLGSTLIEVRGNRRIGSIEGKATVEPVPAIYTLVGLEGAMPTLAALCKHTTEIFEDFRGRFFGPPAPARASR
jgi:hypothetical protein